MDIIGFSEKYRVRLTRPSSRAIPPDSEPVVEGKVGMIGDDFPQDKHGQERMLLHLLATPRHASMDRTLFSRGRAAEAAGFKVKVRSGAESVWYFDPTDETHAQAAIEIVGAKRRRKVTVTPELLARLAAWRQKAGAVIS